MFNVDKLPATLTQAPTNRTVIERADLSSDQVEVFDQTMSWYRDPNARQYLKIGGYAGVGKTTLVAGLARELERQGERIAYCAFTGKAVNVMSKKLHAAGVTGWYSTLHALMYRPKSDGNGKITGWEKTDMLPFTLIVVDEASMVGAELWEDLLSYRIPIIAVGDHGQLPPVGDSVVNLMSNPDLRLEKIHRQAEGNPILALAQWVREGNSHLRFTPTDSRVTFIPSAAAIADKLKSDPMNTGAICYTNRTRASLNKMIRAAKGVTSVYPVDDDVVICLKNKKPIFNGMRGIIKNVNLDFDSYDNFKANVDFNDDGIRLSATIHMPQFGLPKTMDDLGPLRLKYSNPGLSWNQIGMLFDYGYAMTCHKAQGSQFRDVVIIWENLFKDNDTRSRWMYTAVTRAAEQLYIVRT